MEKYICRRVDGDFSVEEQNAAGYFAAADCCALVKNATGGAPERATELKLCYTDRNLYAYFASEDTDIVSNYQVYNDPLYTEDVVELFISPTGERGVYLELEFNANAAVFCGAILNDCKGNFKLFLAPESDICCRCARTEKGWNCLIKIPFSTFLHAKNLPPMRGESWLFNAFRIDYNRAGDAVLYAASPTMCSSFHTPSAFIPLTFHG